LSRGRGGLAALGCGLVAFVTVGVAERRREREEETSAQIGGEPPPELVARFREIRHAILDDPQQALDYILALQTVLVRRYGLRCPSEPEDVNDQLMGGWSMFLGKLEGVALAGRFAKDAPKVAEELGLLED